MDILSINEDIIYHEVVIDTSNDFNIWNIKNDFICIKIEEDILFNYNAIKIIFHVNTKNINLEYIIEEQSIYLDKVNDKISEINNYFQNNILNSIINYLDYINTNLINLNNMLLCNDSSSDDSSSEESSSSNIEEIKINKILSNITKKNGNSILKHIKVIINIITDYNNINYNDNIYIYRMKDNLFDLNIEFFEFINNDYLNNLIKQDIIESIKINIKILVDYFPKMVFLINFNNILFKQDIFKELYNIESLEKLVNKIYNILDDNNNINKIDQKNTLNYNILLLKQITELELKNPSVNNILIDILKNINTNDIDDIEDITELYYYLDKLILYENDDIKGLIDNIKKN